jgi:protein-tyrosine phosphatase
MAQEIKQKCAVDIPTVDFQTPDRKTLYRGLSKAIDLILAGEPVYVGCMGGKGRTGLFLAVLAKAYGIKKPVEFVRANYYAHAVETKDQYDFVKRFTITPPLRRKINWLGGGHARFPRRT